MNRVSLILGSINSYSIGAARGRVEQLYDTHMKPFIQSVYGRKGINLTLYYSGAMYDWLEEHHGEYLTVLSELLGQKRVEILGGGYYDPIFPVIPKLDRLGQIEHLNNRIRQFSSRRPRGAWLNNFFWEPDIPGTLHSAGIEYTFLDDTFFERAGMEARDLLYPAITEDQGKTLVVFPVSGEGRRRFWKSSPEDFMAWLLAQGSPEGDRVLVLVYDAAIAAGDGNGKEAEYKKQWLDRFLDLLEEAQARGEVDTVLPPKLLKQPGYMTRAYFEAPTLEEVHAAAVGHELSPPSLETRVLLPGINRLGYFAQKNVRHSLARYPEANLLYAKMQYIHSLVSQLKGDKYRKQASREALWEAQNHAPYWHGPDGGLYMNAYRKASYRSLIDSEKSTREKGIFAPGFVTIDFDFDGVEEYLYQGNELNAYVHRKGGLLFELDYLANPWNYADTCSRHPEMYHLAAQESEGNDTYPRRMFLDHFLEPQVGLEDFAHSHYREQGSFIFDTYHLEHMERSNHSLELVNAGKVACDKTCLALGMKKRYRFQKNHIIVSWELLNSSDQTIRTTFAPEFNLGFASMDPQSLRIYSREGKVKGESFSGSGDVLEGVHDLGFTDLVHKVKIEVRLEGNDTLWIFPLETSVKTSEGFVREYQATCVVPLWKLDLAPGQTFRTELELAFLKSG